MHMIHRYLLYIDILGFSDLVAAGSPRVHDLYEVIASLNVHRHSAFRAIVFSDTVLVYNTVGGDTKADRESIVMFLCEFSQFQLFEILSCLLLSSEAEGFSR